MISPTINQQQSQSNQQKSSRKSSDDQPLDSSRGLNRQAIKQKYKKMMQQLQKQQQQQIQSNQYQQQYQKQLQQQQQQQQKQHPIYIKQPKYQQQYQQKQQNCTNNCIKILIYTLIFILLNTIIIIYKNPPQFVQKFLTPINKPTITVIFYSFEGGQYLKHSLHTFNKLNKYQINNFIGIIKQFPNQQIIKQYNNIIWIINNQQNQNKWYNKLDIILNSQFITDYYFIFNDQWMFVQSGFIQKSINILQNYQDITQVLFYDSIIRKKGIHQTYQQGFSFTPGLHRRSDLIALQGGFTNFMDNVQQKLQIKLSNYFLNKHKYALHTKNIYIRPMYSSSRFRVTDVFQEEVRKNQEIKKLKGKSNSKSNGNGNVNGNSNGNK